MTRRVADEYLCSLELHAPTQLRSDEGFSLFAVLAFDRRRIENLVEDRIYSLRYGFEAAELRLRINGGQMAPTGRYSKSVKARVRRSEREQTARDDSELSVGGEARTPRFLGLFSFGGRKRRARQATINSTVVETDTVEYESPVVQRHGGYWRIYGTGDADGLLCGQLLGDEKLCDIIHTTEACEIHASVFVDLVDLRVQMDGPDQPDVVVNANRDAVITALVARALQPEQDEAPMDRPNAMLLVDEGILIERALPGQPRDGGGA